MITVDRTSQLFSQLSAH